MNKIILLSGPISSGKSTLARGLADGNQIIILKTNEILKRQVRSDLKSDRKVLQGQGERLDIRTRGRWVLEGLRELVALNSEDNELIVDSVRIPQQIDAIRDAYGSKVIHVHLTAPLNELEQRFNKRRKLQKEKDFQYAEVKKDPTEKNVGNLAIIADIVIDTKRCTEQDVLVRTMRFPN